jgi:hypothetical protein
VHFPAEYTAICCRDPVTLHVGIHRCGSSSDGSNGRCLRVAYRSPGQATSSGRRIEPRGTLQTARIKILQATGRISNAAQSSLGWQHGADNRGPICLMLIRIVILLILSPILYRPSACRALPKIGLVGTACPCIGKYVLPLASIRPSLGEIDIQLHQNPM